MYIRDPAKALHQVYFMLFPRLQRYGTSDLWASHPTKAGLWRYAGRTDNLVVLLTGLKIHSHTLEVEILQNLKCLIMILATSGKPFVRVDKGSVNRRKT